MKREVSSLLFNKLRKNLFAIGIIVIVLIISIVFFLLFTRCIDVTSFYFINKDYDILVSKVSIAEETEAYLIDNDYVLQKNDVVINSQGIMLGKDSNLYSIIDLDYLNKNEIIVSRYIAFKHNVKVGDTLDIDINYNHKVEKYIVVGICDYMFDINEDVGIFSSPLFFVGFDENYYTNTKITYLTFYNQKDIISNVGVENIIANYNCLSRALFNGFILLLFSIINLFIIIFGYYYFSCLLDKRNIFRLIRNSGILYCNYKCLISLVSFISICIYYFPVFILLLVSLLISKKIIYYLLLIIVSIILVYIVEINIYKRKENYLGEQL